MQASFSDLEYAAKKRVTRRDRFLSEIEAVTPWLALVAEIERFYPKGEGRSRPPIGVHRMLRMYIAQQCFGLSDEGIEDAIYDPGAGGPENRRCSRRACRCQRHQALKTGRGGAAGLG